MNTSEVLNKAADLIEERGWTTGNGWHGTAEAEGLCLEGAIQAAMGVAEGSGYRCDAYRAVSDYLGRGALFLWNDQLPYLPGYAGYVGGSRESSREHGRLTVIATLRSAALIESARERQAAEVSA